MTLHNTIDDAIREEISNIRDHHQQIAFLKGQRDKLSKALPAEYCITKILARRQSGDRGIPSGVRWWDEFAGPFRRANLYAIAGYQGSGKSTLAINLAWPMAQRGVKVWYYCMELDAAEQFELLAGHILKKAVLTPEDEIAAYAEIQGSGFRFFEPERDLGWEAHIVNIVKTVRQENIDFVIIDNFSYLTSVQKDSYGVERVASKSLKGLSQELDIPILTIAHLRKPENDEREPEPKVHSILGSGAITQVASDAFILHHPLQDNEEQTRHHCGYVLSGKPRWGKGGKRYVSLNGSTRTYHEATVFDYPKKKRRVKESD